MMSDHAHDGKSSPNCSSSGNQNGPLPEIPRLRRYDSTDVESRLARRPTFQRPITEPVHSASLICGLLAGISQAGLFNPYDRALYLSVTHDRPFLSRLNWQNPYTGFAQSIGGRALQGGLYFPAEHFFLRCINSDYATQSDPKLNLLAGVAAGALNATVLNPISAVKYKTWGRDVNRGMMHEVFGMLQKAGSIRPFFNGLYPTVIRDVVFGGTYTWLRFQIPLWCDFPSHQHWIGNFVAAALATVMSGPFNYVRNMQFATPSNEKAASTYSILRDLTLQTSTQEGVIEKMLFVQSKLRIGWGTARVAMGMTFAHSVYDYLHETLIPKLRKS